MRRAVQFAGLTLTGLLAGNELGTLIGSHPALRSLPLAAEIEAEQAFTARLGQFMPVYKTSTLVAAVAAAVDRRGAPGRRLAAASAAASALALVITLAGNVPLNARTLSYLGDGPADGWADIRDRWERLHRVRVLLELAAFGALTTAALNDA